MKICYTDFVLSRPPTADGTFKIRKVAYHLLNTPNTPTSNPRRQKDREIARLRSELAAERSHSSKLEREITKLKQELKDKDHAQIPQPIRRLTGRKKNRRPEDRLLSETNRHVRYYRKSSFFRYMVDSFRESAFMRFVTKLRLYLKRFRRAQAVIPIVLAAGAMVAVAFVSPLATLILAAAIILPTTFILLRFHRMNRILRQELRDRRIRILIPPLKSALADGSLFIRNARAMAAEDKVTVVVVTPQPLSRRGLGGRKAFFTARKEAEGLYLVRRHYFFTLRRKVLDVLDGEITVIY